jgi:DNA-binding FadR family transcriptional regulator
MGLSGHQRLVQQYGLIEQQVRRYMSFSNDVLTIPEDIVMEHEALVDAILDGDADTAEELARTHNIEECQNLHDQLVNAARDGAE